MRFTTFEGVRFYEGDVKAATRLGAIEVRVGGVFTHSQLKSLDDVKRVMADRVKAAGGNAVTGFTYGQKSVGFFRSLIDLDDVNWYGTGQIAVVSQ